MLDSPECLFILEILKRDLPAHLKYHNLGHTLDVCAQSAFIAGQEGVTGHELDLLLVAAAYHDSGYLHQRKDHEDISCDIARDSLIKFSYSNADIETICSIIMATKLPQNPNSLLEEIICDADMDYLGRDDFFEIGDGLYQEMLHAGVVSDKREWNLLQLVFLQDHHYFTNTSKRNREQKKQENINALKAKLQIT